MDYPAEDPEKSSICTISPSNSVLRWSPNSTANLIANDSVFQKLLVFGHRVSDKLAVLIPKRFILVTLGFLGIVNHYAMSINLSVAIVAMTNFTPHVTGNASVCPTPSIIQDVRRNITHHIQSPVFHWNTITQGNILAAYFYGNLCSQFTAGWIARRFGGKYVFGLAIVIAGIATLIIPKATELGGSSALVALRFIEGLATGCSFPAMHQLLSQWSPPRERTRICAIVFAGAPVGTVIAMGLSGYVGDLLGWQWIFSVFGAASCVWFVLWVFFVSSTPGEHSTISASEKAFIEGVNSVEHRQQRNSPAAIGQLKPKNAPVPWRQLLTSPAVWAIFLGQFGHSWGSFTLMTNLPTYMKNIQQIQLSRNGLFSAVSYILLAVFVVLGAIVSDFIRQHRIMSTTNVRKLCQTLGNVVPAACIIGVGYVGCDYVSAVILFTIGIGFSGLCTSGFQVNFQDLSPIYAPVIFGLSITLTSAFAIILPPYVVGVVTASGQTEHNWRIIFYISGCVRTVTVIFYVIFASSEVAPWNYVDDVAPSPKTPAVEEMGDALDENVANEKENSLNVAERLHNPMRRRTVPEICF